MLHDRAVAQQDDAVGNDEGLRHVMCRIDDSCADRRSLSSEFLLQRGTKRSVEVRSRFVEEVEHGLASQRPSDADTLLLAARQLCRSAVSQMTDDHPVKEGPCPSTCLVPRYADAS